VLCSPRGFCAGVVRAIDTVERALAIYGAPVYVRHEIVHNKRVVEKLRSIGARFVDELDEIPEGAITVFSAHGVSQKVADQAALRDLPVIDATCPLVAKVHREGQRYAEKGFDVILIGHEGHPEVEGTRGRIPGGVHLVQSIADVDKLKVRDPSRVAYITQTTLSVDDTRVIIDRLKERGARQVRLVCLLGAPQGFERLRGLHPDVRIWTAAIDDTLDQHAYILPGLGDAGDRAYGTR